MVPEDNSLDQGSANSPYDSSLENPGSGGGAYSSNPLRNPRQLSPFRLNKLALMLTGAVLVFVTLIATGSFLLTGLTGNNGQQQAATPRPNNFTVNNLEVQNLPNDSALKLGEVSHLEVNGQLRVSNTVVLAPSTAPSSPTAGQIYYDSTTHAPYYFNGTQFISLAPTPVPQHVTSIGGIGGVISVGNGLQVTGGQLSLSGSAVGSSKFSSLTSGTSSMLVSSDGNGNYTLSDSSVVGTGSAGQIALFTGGSTLGGSALSQSGTALTAGGTLTVTGAITATGGVVSNSLQHTGAGSDVSISAGNDAITFTDGGRTFIFPAGGGALQKICTTGVTCASGGGIAVLLQPGPVQVDNGGGSSLFINNTGGGNLLELQGAGSDRFTVTNGGNATLSGTLAVQGASITSGTASQQGSLILNDGTGKTGRFIVPVLGQNTTYTIPDAGAANATICLSTGNCSSGGAAGGDLTGTYPNPTIAKIQGTTVNIAGLAAGQILQYNGVSFVNQAISGDITFNGSGVATIGAGKVTNADLVNSSLTVTAGTGLSAGGAVVLGGSTTLNLANTAVAANAYGSTTAVPTFTVDAQGRLTAAGTTLLANGGLQNSSLTVTAGSGLAGGGLVALGGATSLTVQYGSAAGTAVQGNTSLTCASGAGNLTGGGNSVTLGSGGSCNSINITNSPTFSGTLSVTGAGGVVVGAAGTTNGSLYLASNSNAHFTILQGVAPAGQDQTITVPATNDPGGNDTVCLLSLANCVGTGGGVSTIGGTQNYITKYNNAGTQITNSQLFDNGTSVGVGTNTPGASFRLDVNGNANVVGNATIGTGLTVTSGGLTVSAGGAAITGNSTVAGTLTGLTGLTSSGTVTFSALNSTGVVHNSAAGVLSTGLVALNTETSGSFVNSLGALTGLTTTGNSGANSTPTLTVTYGSAANTAVQGNTSLTCASGTGNLSGGGNSITLGSGGSCNNLTITNSPTFSGNLAVQGSGGATIGVAGTTAGVLNLANGTNANLGSLQTSVLGQATSFVLPDPGLASDTICLVLLGNCAGSGGGITGSGTSGNIAKFNGAGTITDSGLSESGTTLTYAGNEVVNAGAGFSGNLLDLQVFGSSKLSVDQAGDLTVLGSVTTNAIQHSGAGSNISVSAGNDNITFTDGGRTFSFPAGGGASQIICTTGVTCASGGGVAVLLQPGAVQVDAGAGSSVFINNTGGGNLIQMQGGGSDKFVVTNAGDTTVAGAVTLSSLGAGLIKSSAGGVLSSGVADRNSATYFNNTLSVPNGGTGAATFTTNGILYGSGASAIGVTSAAANSILATNGSNIPGLTQTLPAAVQGNITGTGALTSGSIGSGFGTISTGNNITTTAAVQGGTLNVASSNFTVDGSGNVVATGTGSIQGGSLTIGVAGTTNGFLNLASSANSNLGILQLAAGGLGQATTFKLPDPGVATADICLSTGNCAGSGGGITGSGTSGNIAKFNGSGSIIDSANLSELGSAVFVSGANGLGVTGGGGITLGVGSSVTGSVTFKNATNNNTIGLQAGITGANIALTLPTTVGSNGDCLESNGFGVLSFQSCTGGAGGGVTSIDSQGGVVTLNNSSGSAGAITIDNASTTVKGIAKFNSTNFTDNGSGTINTVQDIASTSSPTFNALTLTGALTVANGGTGAGTFTSKGILFGNGTSAFGVTSSAANSILATDGSSVPGLTQTLPTAVQGNITSTGALASGSIASGFGAISTANNITTSATVQGGTLTVGYAGSSDGVLNIASSSNSNLGTLQLVAGGLGQATTYILPDAGTGSDEICLKTLGNCAGSGGGITGSGTNGNIAKFNGSGTITDSGLSESGTTLTYAGNAVVNAGPGFTGNLLDLKVNGSSKLSVDQAGNLTGGTINGATVTSTTFNTATISGGSLSGGSVSAGTITGGSLSATAVNSLNVGANAISTASGGLTLDSAGGNNISIGGLAGSSDILLGGGSGSTGCTVTNSSGDFGCTGNITGGTYNGAAITSTTFNTATISGGSLSGTAVNGLNVSGTAVGATGALTISSGGVAGLTLTSGSGDITTASTINGQTISSSANFTGTLAVQGTGGATIGSTSNNGNLSFLDGTADGFAGSIQLGGAIGQSTTYTLPDAGAASDEICLKTLGNCAGSGGGITGSGTNGNIAKFNGTSSITDSGLSESGTTLTYAGNAVVNAGSGFTGNLLDLQLNGASKLSVDQTGAITTKLGAGIVQSSAGGLLSSSAVDRNSATLLSNNLNVGNGGTGTNTFTSNGVLYGAGSSALLATSAGTQGQLLFAGSGGTPAFTSTSGDISSSAVTTGQLTVAKLQGTTLTLSSLNSGDVLQYNGSAIVNGHITNSNLTSGSFTNVTDVGTLQSGLNIASGQTYKINGTDINTAGTLSNVAYLNQNQTLTGDNTFSSANGVTIGVQNTTTGKLSFGTSGNNNGLTTLQAVGPSSAGNATVTIPAIGGATSDTVCLLTLANCAGAGGGVTTTGGTQNYITKYNNAGATQITNSQVYDDGNFVGLNTTTNSGQLSITASGSQTGLFLQGAGSGSSADAIIRGGGSTGDLLDLQTSTPTTVLSVSSTGAVLSQNSANSTTAFQIQNAAGTSNLLVADTTNTRIGIGTTPSGTQTLQVTGTTFLNGSTTVKGDLAVLRPSDSFSTFSTDVSSASVYAANLRPSNVYGVNDISARNTLASMTNIGAVGASGAAGIVFGNATTARLYRAAASTLGTDSYFLQQNNSDSTTAFQIQNASAATLFNIDSTASANLITNGDFEGGGTTGWAALAGATLTQSSSHQWQGNNSLSVATTTTANDGAKYAYTFSNIAYSLSGYAKVGSGSISDVNVGYHDTIDHDCIAGATLTTSWVRFTCSNFTPTAGAGYIYAKKTGVSAETFFIDGVQLQTGASVTPFNAGGALQVGGTVNSPLTVQNKQDSTTEFQVVNAAGTTQLLGVDSLQGRVTVGGNFVVSGQIQTTGNTISLNSTSTTNAYYSKGSIVGAGGVSVSDVVVMNSSAQVVDTTTTRDTRVYGVSTANVSAAGTDSIAISGNVSVNADATLNGAINIGDQLVTSTHSGFVMPDNNATTGIVGIALSALGSGTGTVGAEIRSVGGQSTPRFQNTSDSTTAFQIQNAAGTSNLFVADTTNTQIGIGGAPSTANNAPLQVFGNIWNGTNTVTTGSVSVATSLHLTGSNSTGFVSKNMTTGLGGVTINDVVVVNASGQVVDTTTARDTRIYGVAANTKISGQAVEIVISGNYQVTADTGAVALGDQLVVSSTSGQVTVDNNATTGILGTALSTKSAGSSGLVSVAIRPVNGQSTPRFQNTSDSTTAFQIQNAAGTSNLLVADTTNTKLGIGQTPSAGGAALQVTGGITATTGNLVATAGNINATAGTIQTNGADRIDNAGNLVNIGTITSGLINGQTISSSASFTGTLAVNGSTLTVGNPGTTAGSINLANATSARQVVLQGLNPSGAGNATVQIPSIAGGGTDTVCLQVLANCFGTGGGTGITGSGTSGTLAVFTGSGSIGNSVTLTESAGALTDSGTLTVQGSGGLTVGVQNTVTGKINLGTNGNNNGVTVVQATGPSSAGNATITIPAIGGGGSDTVCLLTLANCAGAGGGVTTTGGTQNYITKYNNAGATQITNSQLFDNGSFVGLNTTTNSGQLSVVASGSQTGLFLQGAASGSSAVSTIRGGGSTGDLLDLQTSTPTTVLSVSSTGAVLSQNSANSTTAFQIQNAAGTSNLFVVDTTNSEIGINKVPNPGDNQTLAVNGAVGATDYRVTGIGQGISYADSTQAEIRLDTTGVLIQRGVNSDAAATLTVNNFGTSYTGNIFQVQKSGTNVLGIGSAGATTFKNSADSTTAFQIQPSGSSTPTFDVDTVSNRVGIGTAAPNYPLDVQGNLNVGLAVNNRNANTGSSASSVYLLGNDTSVTGGALILGSSAYSSYGGANSLNLVNVESGPLTLGTNNLVQATIANNGATTFKNSADSTAAFQIQNAAGSGVFTADTSNRIVTVGGDLNVGSASSRLFTDGFETGTMGLWSSILNVSPDTSVVRNGTYAAKLNLAGGFNTAYVNLAANATYYARAYVYFSSQSGGAAVNLFDVSASGINQATVYRDNSTGDLCVFVSGSTCSSQVLAAGSWHKIELRDTIGNPGTLQLYYDDTQILNLTPNLGVSNLNRFEIGDLTGSRTALYYIDDVVVNTSATGASSSLNVADDLRVNGSSSFGGLALFQNTADSTTAFQIQNAAGTQVLTVDTTNQDVGIGSSGSASDARLYVSLNSNVKTALRLNQAGTADILQAQANGTNVFKISGTGNILAQNSTDSTTAFQIQNAAGTSNLLVADTTNGKIGIGVAPSSSGATLQVTGTVSATSTVSTTSDFLLNTSSLSQGYIRKTMTAGTGGVSTNDVVVLANDGGNLRVIDSTTARDTRVYGIATATATSGNVVNVAFSGNYQVTADTGAVALGDQLVVSSTSGQVTVDNNATTGILGTALTSKAGGSSGLVSVAIRPVGGQSTPLFSPTSDSTTAFQIQNAARSSVIFDVDTTNGRVGIGKNNPTATLDVNGIVQGSSLYSTGKIVLNTNSAIDGRIAKVATAGIGGVSTNDVVVMNSSSQVVDSTTARDTRIYGVASVNISAAASGEIVIGGNYQVTADTGAVAIGDQLVVSSTSGQATVDNNATTGILGTATTVKAGGSSGLVGVAIRPVGGQSTPRFQNTADSTTAFQIQNAAGTSNLLVADTTNTRAGIGIAPSIAGNRLQIKSSGNSSEPLTVTASSTSNPLAKVFETAGGSGSFRVYDNAGSQRINLDGGSTSILFGSAEDISIGRSGAGALLVKPSAGNNSTTAFQIQNATAANLFNVDTATSVNLITNGDFEGGGTTGWAALNGATLTQTNSHQWQGNNSLSAATTTTVNDGAKYTGYTLVASTQYTFSFYAKVASGSITDVNVGRQDNTGTGQVDCLTGQTLTTSWTRYSCTFTTAGTINTNYLYIEKTGASAETFFIDGAQLQINSFATAFNAGGALQLNGLVNSPLLIQNKQDSPNAFTVQGTSGTIYLNVSTSAGSVSVGSATGGSSTSIFGGTAGINIGTGGVANTIQIGTVTGAVTQTINVGNNATASSTSNVVIGSTIAGTTTLQSAGGTILSTLGTTNTATYLCRNASNIVAGCSTTGTGAAFVQGGNSFGALATLGTTDANQLTIGTFNGTALQQRINITNTAAAGNNATLTFNGISNFQPTVDTTSAFKISGQSGFANLVVADTTNGLIGINQVPTPGGARLQISGGIALTVGDFITTQGFLSLGGTATTTFTTPLSSSLTTRVNLPVITAGNNNQVIALGLSSTSNDTARGITILDARTSASHSPAFDVISPDEGTNFGLVWQGGSTDAYLQVGTRGGSNGVGRNLNLVAGAGLSGTNAGGNTVIQGGAPVSTGASGSVIVKANTNDSTTAFQIQNAAGNSVFNADTSTTSNLIVGGDFENTFPGAWAGTNATLTQVSAQQEQGGNSMQVVITAANGTATYTYNALAQNTQYTFSFYAKPNGGTISTINVGHTYNGASTDDCTGQTITSGIWTRVTCTFTTANVATTNNANVYIKDTTNSQTFWVDGAQLVTGSLPKAFNAGASLQISGVLNSPLFIQPKSDSPTLFDVQGSTGSELLVADSAHFNVVVGNTTTNAQLQVYGSQYVRSNTGDNYIQIQGGATNAGYLRFNDAGQYLSLSVGAETNNNFKLDSNGNSTFKPTSDSTTAFQIQNALGTTNLLTADTTNLKVQTVGDVNVGSRFGSRLFSDNFESGNFKLWSLGAGGTGSITVDSTTPHDGKYAAKLNTSGNTAYVQSKITASTTVYTRAWVYVTSGTNIGLIGTYLSSNGADGLYVLRDGSGNVAVWNGNSATTLTGGALSTGAWHLIELRDTAATSTTGTTQLWLDGVLQSGINVTNANNGTVGLDTVDVGSNSNQTGVYYVDDFAADTSSTGTASSLNVDDSFHVGGTSSFGNSVLVQPASDSTTAFQIQNAAGTETVLNVDTANGILDVQGGAPNSTLGAEKVTNGTFTGNATGWTLGTGWAYGSNAINKTAGTASAAQQNVSAVNGQIYQVSFDITAWTAGCITPQVGGVSGTQVCYNNTVPITETELITATGTGNLMLNADSSFAGTIDNVSVKRETPSYSAITLSNSTGLGVLEVRASSDSSNIFMGINAGEANNGPAGGDQNTALGTYALQSNISGGGNTALGFATLSANVDGSNNTAVGQQALEVNTSGYQNTALGALALSANTYGYDNTGVGTFSLQYNVSGTDNAGLGYKALSDNNTGSANAAVGSFALANNISGYANAALGYNALGTNTTGYYNSAFGVSALGSNNGAWNTALGYNALTDNTSGTGNVAIGGEAGLTNTSANANVSGSNNTFVGIDAGPGTTTQLQNATAIGASAVVNQNDSLVLGCINGVNGCSANTAVGIGTSTPNSSAALTVQPIADHATLGSELMTGSNSFPATAGWTSISGTGFTATATHTNGGGTTALHPNPALSISTGHTYYVQYAINSVNAGTTLDVDMGGVTVNHYSFDANDVTNGGITDGITITTSSTANLTFTPSNNFAGTITSVSVKEITSYNNNPALVVNNASGSASIEVRGSSDPNTTFVGVGAGSSDIGSGLNAGFGTDALQYNIQGTDNSAFGSHALQFNTNGTDNSAFGQDALQDNTSGGNNAAFGSYALPDNTVGWNNSAFGDLAMQFNSSGSGNAAFGQAALEFNTTGNNNSGLGGGALQSNTTGFNNTGVGGGALQSLTVGVANTAVGVWSDFGDVNGANNTAVGYQALTGNNGSGSDNTALGYQALVNTSGGFANTGVGKWALSDNTTGTNNTGIGYHTDVSAGNLQNATAIGVNAVVGQNDSLVLGCVNGTNGCTANTKVGIDNATPGRTLDVNGNWGGNELDDAQNNNTSPTATVTESTPALAYNLTNNKTAGNNTSTITFNITGLPNTNGTFAYMVMKASHSAGLGGSAKSCVNLTVNSSANILAADLCDTIGNSASNSNFKSFILVRMNGSWTVFATATNAAFPSTADFAEWIHYSGSTQPLPGEVLQVGDSGVSVKDSDSTYQKGLMGVVSTAPFQVGGQDDGHSVVMALTGRVPVKVSLENGPIAKGDYLTSSSTPGVAMKAIKPGNVIGTALEDYDGTQPDAVVTVQLHNGYADPTNGQSANNIQGDLAVSGNINLLGNANIGGDINVAGATTTHLLVVTGDASIAGNLTVTGLAKVQDIEIDGHIITAGGQPVASSQAGAGTGAAVTLSGTDTTGTITITTGSAPVAGDLSSIAFSKLYGATPRILISGQDGKSAASFIYPSNKSANGFELHMDNAPQANTTYTFDYFIAQ